MGLYRKIRRKLQPSTPQSGSAGTAASVVASAQKQQQQQQPTVKSVKFNDFEAEVEACGLKEDWPQKRLNDLFGVFDLDGNGEIDLNEFTVGLLCLVTGTKRDKVRALFQLCDLDASGEIDKAEFYQLLHFLHVELPRARTALQAAPGGRCSAHA